MKQALLIMAKRPEAGRTKTRLCPPMTYEMAAGLYECFLRDVLDIVRAVKQQVPTLQPCIAYAPLNAEPYFAQLAPDFHLVPQCGDALGQRLHHVLTTCLNDGYTQVAAINSDSPTLPPAHLAQAFSRLNNPQTDAVFGPCEDGGYYLIGIDAPRPRLVLEVEMSTPTVLQDTLALAQEDNLTAELLPSWYDVDTIEELRRLYQELMTAPESVGQYTRGFMVEHLAEIVR
ncbi:MAG: TIGR04282 family arsenosugar biosynthesis glycosyltransferase [Chloroflexota bacterium]